MNFLWLWIHMLPMPLCILKFVYKWNTVHPASPGIVNERHVQARPIACIYIFWHLLYHECKPRCTRRETHVSIFISMHGGLVHFALVLCTMFQKFCFVVLHNRGIVFVYFHNAKSIALPSRVVSRFRNTI